MYRTARHIIAAIAIVLTAFTATTAPNTGRLAGGTIGGGGTLDAVHSGVALS